MSRKIRAVRPGRLSGLAAHAFAVGVGLAAAPVHAQQQGLRITPSLSITETITDNRDTASAVRRGDAITQVMPSVSIVGRSGAFDGSLSYTANGVVYARDSSLNTVYHTLSGAGGARFLDGRLGVDATASASRQVISALGTQTVDPSLNTGNQAQVFSYSLSPYLQGQLLGDIRYYARVAYQESRSDADSVGDSSTFSTSTGLSGRLGRVGWGLDANRQLSSSTETRRSHVERLTGSLSYAPDPELQVTLRAGREADDLRTGKRETATTWGAGMVWTPTPRTTLNADTDRHVFGRSHALVLNHRMARTYFSLSDSTSLDRVGASGRGVLTNYELFYPLLSAGQSDPAKKEQYVRDLLIQNGLDPSAAAQQSGGFLASGATLQRRQSGSATYQGLRVTLALSIARTDSRPYGTESEILAGQRDGRIRQRLLNFTLTHRLTPDSSVVVALSQQRTHGELARSSGNDLQSITATWTGRLGPHTSISLGARHVNFDSDINPYQETAVIGTLRMQF